MSTGDLMDIIMHKYKKMDLKGATVINGFPSSGLMSTIVASYLVSALKLDQICGLDSEEFPPVSMVYDSKPKFPARIYADPKTKVVVFLSEFTPFPYMARTIARTILSFAGEEGCARIISPETQLVNNDGLEILAVGSTDAARKDLKPLGIKPLKNSIISGISGVLLNEGRLDNFNVIVPLALRGPDTSDSRIAARVIEIIDILIPTIKIDLSPLYEEAEGVEMYLNRLREQANPEEPSGMYS